MPSKTEGSKGRSKEDTWGAPELTSQLQDATANRERRSKDKVKHRDGDERKHRSKEKPDDEKRTRDKREKSSRDKTAEDGKHRRDERGGKERSSRDDRHKDRETKEKHRDPDDNRDRERRKESDEKEKRRSGRHREKDGRDDRERKERSNKDEERRERKSDKDRKRDDGDDRHKERRERREDRQKDEDDKGSRDRHREKRDKDGKRHKEKDGRSENDHRGEKGKTTKDEERRKRHKEKDSERRNHEEEKRRPHKTGKEDGESSAQDKLQRDEEYEEERRKRKEEKRRERKRREEEERMTVEKTEMKGSSEAEVPEVVEGTPITEANGYDYDDDFEDYEDDFEDEGDDAEDGSRTETDIVSDSYSRQYLFNSRMETDIDDSTLAELRQAMEAENRASSLSGRDTGFSLGQSSGGSTRPTTSTRKTFINFVAAKQRQISNSVAERTKKRGQELMKLIELDTVSFDLFDMPPVKDYERFIQHFGRSDTTQAIVQCNDDNLERDTQTEEIENCDKWCQHPAEGVQCCGGDGATSDDEFDLNVNQEASSLKLTQFLEAASQLMVVLLEESRAEHDGGALQSNQRSIVFSEGYTQLKPGLPFLKTRSILQVHVHPIQTHLLLALYGDMKVPVDKSPLCNRGLLCVWNINDPSQPQKILSCRSQPKCCSWSPMKATMVFAGTVDGSLVIWDLREPSNMHCHHLVDGTSWLVRVPTFCTDGILTEESHNSSVVAILPIVTAEDSLRASMPQEPQIGSDTSFQLASLEETGVIYFWVVLEITKTSQAGSESELGLVPGGRVKLIWSSSISLNTPTRFLSITSNFKTICVQLNPQDPNQFYIGTDRGFVLHASRHHENVYPKIFRASYDVPVEVTHLDFSPFALSCFLVACADGTIRLHSTMYELPLLSWPNSTMGMEVTSIAWSHSRPSVFYTADSTSKVYVWSLLERDANPVKTEQFDNGRLTSLSVSNDYSASSMGRPGRRPELVIGDEKGCLEVHRLNERFSNASGDELDSMSVLLQSFV